MSKPGNILLHAVDLPLLPVKPLHLVLLLLSPSCDIRVVIPLVILQGLQMHPDDAVADVVQEILMTVSTFDTVTLEQF